MFDADTVERFFSHTTRNLETGCLLWTGGLFKDKPYGQFSVGRRNVRAHRYAWALANNTDLPPSNVVIRHTCDNGGRVEADHLVDGTQKQNIQDAIDRGRFDFINCGSNNRNKTHCPKGHEYNDENTYHYRGKRHCRTCADRRARDRYYTLYGRKI